MANEDESKPIFGAQKNTRGAQTATLAQHRRLEIMGISFAQSFFVTDNVIEMLPESIKIHECYFYFCIEKQPVVNCIPELHFYSVKYRTGVHNLRTATSKTLVEALTEMLIWLLKEKLISVKNEWKTKRKKEPKL